MISAGIVGLGLKPHEFWALTPGELMLMLGVGKGAGAMTRSGLETLSMAFPDEKGSSL